MNRVVVKAVLAVLMISPIAVSQAYAAPDTPVPTDEAGFSARALVKSRLETTLSSELSGRITAIHVDGGDRFKKGVKLVTFDCQVQRANLKKAQAMLTGAEATLAARKNLQRYNAVSELDLAQAEAEIQNAQGDVAIAKAEVQGCVLIAPFSGRVVERSARPYEHVAPGQPILKILDDTAMRLEALVPARAAVHLHSGDEITLYVEETGRSYSARIRALGAKVDPSSQTLLVYADVQGEAPDLLAGMSGVVRLKSLP